MIISFRELRGSSNVTVIHDTVTISRISEENANVESLLPVQADLQAELNGHICQIHGQLETEVTYRCSRCLDPCDASLKTELSELFTDDIAEVSEDVHHVGGDVIDLDPYIEQEINLALEYVPLCRSDCKGLCPVCGCNRNHTSCECDTRVIDPRLAALQDLLSSDDSE